MSYSLSTPDLVTSPYSEIHPIVGDHGSGPPFKSDHHAAGADDALADNKQEKGLEEVFRIRPSDPLNVNIDDLEYLTEMLWSPKLIIDLDGAQIRHSDLLRLIKGWASLMLKTGTAAKEIILTSLGQGISSLQQFENVYTLYNETVSAAAVAAGKAESSRLLCQTIFIEFPGVQESSTDVALQYLGMANEVVIPNESLHGLIVLSRPSLRIFQDAPMSMRARYAGLKQTIKACPKSKDADGSGKRSPGGFIKCDSCGKRRLVDSLTISLLSRVDCRFTCGMLEDTSCTEPDEWQGKFTLTLSAGSEGTSGGQPEAPLKATKKNTKRTASDAELGTRDQGKPGRKKRNKDTENTGRTANGSIAPNKGDNSEGSTKSEMTIEGAAAASPKGKRRRRSSIDSKAADTLTTTEGTVNENKPNKAPTAKTKKNGEAGWFRCNRCRKWRRVHVDDMPTIEGKSTFICSDLYQGACDKPDDWAQARRELLYANPQRNEGRKSRSRSRRGSLKSPKGKGADALQAAMHTDPSAGLASISQPPPRLRYAAAEYEPPPPSKTRRTLNPPEVDEALNRLMADDEGKITMLYIGEKAVDGGEGKEDTVFIPEKVLGDEASIRTFLYALRGARNFLRYIRFPESPTSPFTDAFTQEHLDMFADIPVRWKSITHIDFGALGCAGNNGNKSKMNILRPILRMMGNSGLTHINVDTTNCTDKALQLLQEKTARNREKYWKGFEQDLSDFTEATKK
ncbi:hypothetical protein FOL47_004790 [Perkinsus chesapeaki]|uniref:CW-type domain-containing protein n=1 Tax=Perkinsus chesapeaki TaxID=330153 RepID=A0A7J6M1Z2_PERCH|nr:hypothetical protein FOL47_004790 [Perkinsus chesapeaki]